MIIFLIILVIWLMVGLICGVRLMTEDDDITLEDVWLLLVAGLFGFVMIVFLYSEGIFNLPKILNKNQILFKKRKK